MAELTFDVYGRPAPQGSKHARAIYRGAKAARQFTGKVVAVEMSRHLAPWRDSVKTAALAVISYRHDEFPLTGALAVSMAFTVARPKGHYRTGRNAHLLRDNAPARPAVTPDLSKLLRSTEDALTDAGVWADDKLVVEYSRAAKVYANEDPDALLAPGVRITIREVALMPWFMVDDRFHGHRKAVRAGTAAVGLWVLAGSWCGGELTDGFIPDYVAARLDPEYVEHAARLVDAGLWLIDEHDGDKGWRFHEWTEFQKSREQVLGERAEAKERMRRVRAAKKAKADVRANMADVQANASRTEESVRANEQRTHSEPVATKASAPGTGPHSNGDGLDAERVENGVRANKADVRLNKGDVRAKFARSSPDVRSTPSHPIPAQPIEELPASPSEHAAGDTVQAELFDDDTAEDRETSTAVAVAEPVTGGTIVKALIDACRSRGIELPKRLIGQYAKTIKGLLDEGYTPQQIWAALSLMAEDSVLNRPSLLTNKIVTVQTGPERAPARVVRSTTDDRVAGWLTLDLETGAA